MRAYERFLTYAAIDTQSCEANEANTPSSDKEFNLSRLLRDEMEAMGLDEVYMDDHAYVYGAIPATAGHEADPSIGFVAHIDIVEEFGKGDPKPVVVENYDGSIIKLGDTDKTLNPLEGRDPSELIGKTIIHADGTTVLGADDKAGVAEILTMCEELLKGEIPHGRIAVCFTPDEEIGHGAALLDLDRFACEYAYTVDGDAVEMIEYETFNAARADWAVTGYSVHPGSSKDIMINASLVAMEIDGMLPKGQTPRDTSGYEGFYHLLNITGDCSNATLNYILRDHDENKLEEKKQKMREIEAAINAKWGEGTAVLTIKDQYKNMSTIVNQHPEIIKRAQDAIKACGLTPQAKPVRGGTDGAQLSFRGLPCPNLGTGGRNFHGPYEYCVVEEMDTAVEILVNIARA